MWHSPEGHADHERGIKFTEARPSVHLDPQATRASETAAALDVLWSAMREAGLDEYLAAGGSHAPVSRFRPEMRVAVDAARGSGLYAEQLLWLLKESWRALPEVRRNRSRYVVDGLLERVVSLCIDEFYR